MSYNMSEFTLVRKLVAEIRKLGEECPGALGKLDKLDEEQLGLFLSGLRRIVRFLPNSYGGCLPRPQFDLLLCAANQPKGSITAEWAAWHVRTNVETVLDTARELSKKHLVEKIVLKRKDDPQRAEIIPTSYGREIIEGAVGTIYGIMNSAVKDFSDEELSEYIRLQNKFLDNFSKEEAFLRINKAL